MGASRLGNFTGQNGRRWAVTNPTDDRSPLAKATEWATSVTAIACEMAVPLLVGVWIDRRLGTRIVFAGMGGLIGLAAGIWSLLRSDGYPSARQAT